MSRKTKRLIKVIEARERVRDRHAAETAAAERDEAAARTKEADVQHAHSAFLAGIEDLIRAPISANTLLERDHQRKMWSSSIDQAARVVAQQTAVTEKTRARLVEAARSLRISEKAHERISALEQRERDQREQKSADDLSASRRPR